MTEEHNTAVVLFSGGMDSGTMLAMALEDCIYVHPMTFDYGQRHIREVKAATSQWEYWSRMKPGKIHPIKEIKLDLRQIGGSALTSDVPVPKTIESRYHNNHPPEIPSTYVPARNTIFLAIALGYAEVRECNQIWIGANVIDYSGYPDCRPEYFKAMQEAFNLATKMSVSKETGGEGKFIEVRVPLLNMSKKEIVEAGEHLKVPWNLTWSCYSGGEKACGKCDSCRLRLEGFTRAGVKDPLPYEVEQ